MIAPSSSAPSSSPPRILLTGATGFVGGAVAPALVAAGWAVRGLTRNAARAAAGPESTQIEWVQGDVASAGDCVAALRGCQAALYLVHAMGEGADYHAREQAAAETFARAAAAAGVERIVYLGGVAPPNASRAVAKQSERTKKPASAAERRGNPPDSLPFSAAEASSAHLQSRLAVGAVLRAGSVPTIELRASMIVGHGSLSWLIVRDLAARLPIMVLPRWLRSRTEPVAIDDVVAALLGALTLPAESAWYDIPGPEILSGKQILEQTSDALGLPRPLMVGVPLLTPRLSSFWVRFVTRAQWSIAREVVVGLTEDLLAGSAGYWDLIGHSQRLSFAEAARRALVAERQGPSMPGIWGRLERARQR